MKGDTKILT